jgi:hypothetical protein
VIVGDGSILGLEDDGLAVRTGDLRAGWNVEWFDFRQRNVVIEDLDGEILGKTRQLPRQLNAKVQGYKSEVNGAEGGVIG